MKSFRNNDLVTGCLCAIGCEVFYGLSYMFTKSATESASTLALLGWRFFVAIIVINLFVAARIIKIDLKGKSKKPLLLIALFSPCMYFIGETVGIGNTTASEAGVFLACIPIVSLAASSIILKKQPTKVQVIGILTALAGVAVTVLAVGASSSLSPLGYAFLLLAVVAYAMYSVFVDKASGYTSAEITYVMLAVGSVMFVILAISEALINRTVRELITLPFRDFGFLAAILYLGIGCSIGAFFLSNLAISKIGVNRNSSFIGIATVVSIIAGALILKETFTIYQFIGAVVIIAGVYIANVKRKSAEP